MTHRILIVVHGYPPTARGGAEIHAARTAVGLTRRGLDVRALAFESHSEGGLSWTDTSRDGVLVRRLVGNLVRGQDPFGASFDNRAVAGALRTTLDEWSPQLVYLFGGYLMSASVIQTAREAGIPVVVNLADHWWFCHRINLLLPDGTRCDGPSPAGCARCYAERKRRWRLPAEAWPAAASMFWRLAPRVPGLAGVLGLGRQRDRTATVLAALRQARALISPSRYLAEFYVRNGVDPDHIRLCRQGVDVRQCPLRSASVPLRFGYVGQVKAHKGVALLLEAWSRLTGARARRLTLHGSDLGEEAFGRWVRQRIAELSDVEWHGEFLAGWAWDALSALDVLILPSRCNENCPNVILEAQVMGVPVVGSNLGGIPELVGHEHNGLLFEGDNAIDLARQLQRLLDEPGLVQRLSRHALPLRILDDEFDELLPLFHQFLPG